MRFATFLACITAVCITAGATRAQASVSVGDKPQLRLRTLDNKALTSKDLEGRIVVLEFWATWCPPCVKEVPHIKELNAKYSKQGVRLVSVSLDRGRGEAMAFIREHGMNWTHAMDNEQPGGQLSDAFGVSGIPHAFIISPEGQVLWRGHPASIDGPLAKALEEHPPKPSAESLRDEAIDAIMKAAELIDKKNDYARAYEAIAAIDEETLKDAKVAQRFKALAYRFKPTGRRAEALDKFYKENPQAKERLAKLGVQVEAAVSR